MEGKGIDLAKKLREFEIKDVRFEESFEIGGRRINASDVTIAVRKRIVLGCTDERPVSKLLDPRTGASLDLSQYSIARIAGAAFGVVDAVRNVRVTVDRKQIIDALVENGVLVANHVDTHAKEGKITGCGYAALRALYESTGIFDRPPVDVTERARSFEEQGVYRMVLDGEHTAAGLIVNPYTDKVLDPAAGAAEHSFFSIDLGVYRKIIHWVAGALNFGEETEHSILVKLTRNNLSCVFILSNGMINEAVFIERDDDKDPEFAGILHEAMVEFKEREAAIVRMIEARRG
jgi:hypothetical protein